MLIVSILILCFTGMGDRDGASAFILLRSKARGIGLIAAGQIFLDYAWLEIVIQGLLDPFVQYPVWVNRRHQVDF
jgi:hypothetical protein